MRSRRTAPRLRAILGWGCLLFLLLQVLILVMVEGYFPETYDPEYDVRIHLLRQALAEHPDRPLLLLTGSSRTAMCFRPEVLQTLRDPSGTEVLPFNLSHFGGNHTLQLMLLRRLLRQGI